MFENLRDRNFVNYFVRNDELVQVIKAYVLIGFYVIWRRNFDYGSFTLETDPPWPWEDLELLKSIRFF
jgi:hypothetical protein